MQQNLNNSNVYRINIADLQEFEYLVTIILFYSCIYIIIHFK